MTEANLSRKEHVSILKLLQKVKKLRPYPAVATITSADLAEVNDRVAAKTTRVTFNPVLTCLLGLLLHAPAHSHRSID